MTDQFSMFKPAISSDTTSATSSPESAAGPTPSNLLDGPKTDPSGPAPVPVSRFRALDSEKAMTTNDTSGPLFTHSSPSADLQRSLENRLRARMDVNGSPEYVLTWKEWDMPSGLPICALRALARRTSGNGYGGWPTTSGIDHMPQSPLPEHLNAYLGQPSPRMQAAGWPTPDANAFGVGDSRWQEKRQELKEKKINGNGFGMTLGMASQLVAGWPTPKAQRPDQVTTYAGGNPTLAKVAGWATPTVVDATGSKYAHASGNHDKPVLKLPGQAALSPAPTTSKGASLNPAFSLWLMGYPPEWESCAARVTRSSRKSRQSS